MNARTLVLTLIALGVAGAPARAFDVLQRAERAAQRAQEAMARGDTLVALDEMLRAQALAPDDSRIRAGLAETLYDGGEYEAAIRQFEPLARPEAPLTQRRRALYNAGNAAFEQQDYERALQYYTQAVLEGDSEPGEDLLHNLELAQLLFQQQERQRQQSDQSSEDGESQEGDEQQQDQQQSEGDQQPPEDQESQSQDQPREDDQQQAPPDSTQQDQAPPDPEEAGADSTQASPPPPVDQMTPEQAMRLLEALDHDEQELRESIQRRLRGAEEETEHDW